jgi:hypothetical protein
MKVGDLMRCTFSCGRSQTLCVLVEKHSFDDNFWNILWNGEVLLMHTDHLIDVINR